MLACLVVAALPSSAAAATTVSNTPSSFTTCSWGFADSENFGSQTFGQTILVPANDSTLDSFTFYVTQLTDSSNQPVGDPASIDYKAYVAEWDGFTVGNILWQSGTQTVQTLAYPARQPIVAETGGLQLTSGVRYAFFVSTAETVNSVGDVGCAVLGGTYGDGTGLFVAAPFGEQPGWSNDVWQQGFDHGFVAEFSSPAGEPVYDFDGFYAPVNNKDASGNYIYNRVRAGSAIPVRFSLGGDRGLDIFDAGYPRSESVACNSQAEVDGIEQTVEAGGSSLSYAAGSDTYTYVWKTDRSWEDSCRQLVVRFDDGTVARANFSFTR